MVALIVDPPSSSAAGSADQDQHRPPDVDRRWPERATRDHVRFPLGRGPRCAV